MAEKATLKSCLKSAREELARGEYKAACQHCKAALKVDKNSYDAFIVIGKAAFKLEEYSQSEMAYRKAVGIQPEKLTAWQGLLELFQSMDSNEKTLEALQELTKLTNSDKARCAEYTKRLAFGQKKAGDLEASGATWQQLLDLEPPEALRASALCGLADIQIAREEEMVVEEVRMRSKKALKALRSAAKEAGKDPEACVVDEGKLHEEVVAARAAQPASESAELEAALARVAAATAVSAEHEPYHTAQLRRVLARAKADPSAQGEALEHCLAASRKQCCSVFPYDCAVQLQAELHLIRSTEEVGAETAALEQERRSREAAALSKRYLHAFPWAAGSATAMGCALAARKAVSAKP
eukprot:gene25668-31388_t